MNYNEHFEDLMNSINDYAKGIGFRNGIDWASRAQERGEISYSDFRNFENCHNLRIRFSHGNARDIKVSKDTYRIASSFYNKIQRSGLTSNSNNYYSQRKLNLPHGIFRSNYRKDFDIEANNGKVYHFEFEIAYENNYVCGDTCGSHEDGYFIHVLDAPYFSSALEDLHKFHLIKTGYNSGHICWNEPIKDFKQANAVMFVWVKRYVALLEELEKRHKDTSESNLLRHAKSARVSLPGGTFRSKVKSFKGCGKHYYDKPHQDISTSQVALRHIDTIYMRQDVYDNIMSILGTRKPELGGMLGCSSDDTSIDVFEFDEQGQVGPYEYNPNLEHLNKVINDDWMPNNIQVGGFVHSHPVDFNILSSADIEYAVKIMKVLNKDFLFMPIVTSSYAYKKELTPYIIYRNGKVDKCILELYQHKVNNIDELDVGDTNLDDIEKAFDNMSDTSNLDDTNNEQEETFDRIKDEVDLSYLKSCHVIGIGCGGSRGFYEDMVRCGVGKFTLIDGDKSSITNIASQNGYISDIGHYKVKSLMRRMYDINDEIEINAVAKMLDHDIDNLLDYGVDLTKVDPSKTIICAFTDDFEAQKTAEELAFKYHIPYLAGQHHAYGNTSEVTYYYPGVTTYRVKDVLKTRYKAYEQGYQNDVTSIGSLIFNTTRINSLCEKLAIGMLLYGKYPDCKYSTFIQRRKDRNLIIIRQVDLLGILSSLKGLFTNEDKDLFDDVCWVDPNEVWEEEA